MPSPFSGMDPYLETPARWREFHHRFITHWCDVLNELLPDHYEARIDERASLIDTPETSPKVVYPDVGVAQTYPLPTALPGPQRALARQPVLVPMRLADELQEGYIELINYPDQTLIAVLELLSPSNKNHPDRREYLLKRNAVLRQEVHLVELDLLLDGQRLPMGGPLPAGDYYAIVSRAGVERRHGEVYSWRLREPFPTILLPLKEPDPDLAISLQAVFNRTYDQSHYSRALKYQSAPAVMLTEEDQRWVEELLRPLRTRSQPRPTESNPPPVPGPQTPPEERPG
jgi:hypothetical protein